MDSKKMTIISIVIFVLSLLVFVSTVFLVFYLPGKKAQEKSGKPANTINVEIGDVSTQIGGTGRYYKGFIYLEVVGKKTPEKINEKMPQVKDTILTVISASDLSDITGNLAPVKEKIKTNINGILKDEVVVDVLFTESIVQ